MNDRLKKLFDATDEAMQVFDDYAGCIGVSKARRGYSRKKVNSGEN